MRVRSRSSGAPSKLARTEAVMSSGVVRTLRSAQGIATFADLVIARPEPRGRKVMV